MTHSPVPCSRWTLCIGAFTCVYFLCLNVSSWRLLLLQANCYQSAVHCLQLYKCTSSQMSVNTTSLPRNKVNERITNHQNHTQVQRKCSRVFTAVKASELFFLPNPSIQMLSSANSSLLIYIRQRDGKVSRMNHCCAGLVVCVCVCVCVVWCLQATQTTPHVANPPVRLRPVHTGRGAPSKHHQRICTNWAKAVGSYEAIQNSEFSLIRICGPHFSSPAGRGTQLWLIFCGKLHICHNEIAFTTPVGCFLALRHLVRR